MIKIGIVGSCGKMGKEIVKAVLNAEDMELVCAVDIVNSGMDAGVCASVGECGVKTESDLNAAIDVHKPDIVIDFTQPASIFEHVCLYMNKKVKSIIGTTGLTESQIKELETLSKENNTGCLIAPNFSTGAVLLMMFAKQAAKYFDNAEIIELHHNQKKDAPSGTAIKTAQMMAENNKKFTTGNCPEKELIAGARGAVADSEIHIHSVRLPGYIASQEVIFGSSGQLFKIKHDTMDRACYMSGILLATRHVAEHNDFVYGLDNIM